MGAAGFPKAMVSTCQTVRCYQEGHIPSTETCWQPVGWHETDVLVYCVSSLVVEWYFSSFILDLGTIRRLCGSFTFKPLYPRRRAPIVYWIGSWVSPTAFFDALKKREICVLSVNRTPCRPPRNLVSKRTAIIGCPVGTFRNVFDATTVPQM